MSTVNLLPGSNVFHMFSTFVCLAGIRYPYCALLIGDKSQGKSAYLNSVQLTANSQVVLAIVHEIFQLAIFHHDIRENLDEGKEFD